jgi:hypothetical protein
MKFLSGLVAAALLTVAVPVCAQSLGDLAKKEAERRKASQPAAKTYTNEDLKKLPPPVTGAQEEPTKVDDVAKPVAPKGEAVKDGEPVKDEKYWRGRMTSAKEEVRRNEMFRDALNTRIGQLAADIYGQDDAFRRIQLTDDKQKAVTELARVTSEIEKSTKQVGDIEDEARRAGVPPGWLR